MIYYLDNTPDPTDLIFTSNSFAFSGVRLPPLTITFSKWGFFDNKTASECKEARPQSNDAPSQNASQLIMNYNWGDHRLKSANEHWAIRSIQFTRANLD